MACRLAIFDNNLIDSASSITGGSWAVALPASNVGTLDYAEVARSSDALIASTKFIVDHGSAKTAWALVLKHHNLSADAQVRWSRGTSSGGNQVYAGSFVDAWQFTPRQFNGHDHEVMLVMPTANSARYDLIEIDDTANSDGYVEIARVFIGTGISPGYGAAYGLRDGVIDLGKKERAFSGVPWTTQRRKLRTVSFELPWLTLAEGNTLHEVTRMSASTEEVVYVPDLDDMEWTQRFGFLGTMEEVPALEYPYPLTRGMAFRLTQS